jgi:hypothetical protein
MKLKIFMGRYYDAQREFNEWAKGKSLNREVLIHEQVILRSINYLDCIIAIFVYCPESMDWDKPTRKLTTPIHEEPEEHIKEEEVVITT